jgi:hypothetical protein
VIVTWSPEELNSICSAVELHIAVIRPGGRLRRWTPIWVVCVDEQVYVRTWYRRETGWFGHALSHAAPASAFPVWQPTLPSKTSVKGKLTFTPASMPHTAPSTATTAQNPW